MHEAAAVSSPSLATVAVPAGAAASPATVSAVIAALVDGPTAFVPTRAVFVTVPAAHLLMPGDVASSSAQEELGEEGPSAVAVTGDTHRHARALCHDWRGERNADHGYGCQDQH